MSIIKLNDIHSTEIDTDYLVSVITDIDNPLIIHCSLIDPINQCKINAITLDYRNPKAAKSHNKDLLELFRPRPRSIKLSKLLAERARACLDEHK